MDKYNYYTGIDIKGNMITSHVDAESLEDAYSKLRAMGINEGNIVTAGKVVDRYKECEVIETHGGILEVYFPIAKTRVVVAWDESKSCGRKVFVDEENTIEFARKLIDWTTIR